MYEYECGKCGHRFELIQKFSDRPKTKCPKCRGTLRKLLSASAIRFKGSGWYVTDYARKTGSTGSEKSSEPPPSGGEGKTDAKPESKEKTGDSAPTGGKSRGRKGS